MQIMQFLIGTVYASLHSFVSYTIPVQTADVGATVNSAVSTASAVASSAVAAASSAGLGNLAKKLLFRAAGEEGLAENVAGAAPTAVRGVPSSGSGSLKDNVVKYHTEYQTIPCIDTSGQTFAIWLNVFYLTPLTFLFARFFVKSYLRRSNVQSGKTTKHITAASSAKDALKGVEREMHAINGNGNANGKLNGSVGKANGKANGFANGHSSPKGKANGKH